MGDVFASLVALLAGVGVIVWGAEAFAEHLASAAARLKISSFALALLLAGAEPEELATAVAATMRGAPAIAFGDVIGANVAICLIALGVGAVLAPIPFGRRVLRYAVLGLPAGCVSVAASWDGRVGRFEGALLVLSYVGYVAAIWIAERQPPTLGETAELVGSFAYNATMTLGAAAGVRPLRIADAGLVRMPALVMLAALALPIALAGRDRRLARRSGLGLLSAYPLFISVSLAATRPRRRASRPRSPSWRPTPPS